MNRSVSVIVPAYNAGKTIKRCMDGLVKQTYRPTEIIIVDDGSTDGTATILDGYGAQYEYIRVIHQNNTGVSAARNRGLDEASSDCIVFVDSDDEVGEEYLETLMENAEFDYVTCGFHMQKPDLEWDNIVFVDESQQMDVIREHPSKYMGNYYFGSPWAKLYKLGIINQSRLRFSMDIHNGEDILFNFQYMLLSKTIRIVPLCDYYYYFQKSSLSHSTHPDSWKWEITREKTIKEYFDCSFVEEYQFERQREFGILKQLLNSNAKNLSGGQIKSIYEEPLFQQCIQYKKKEGTLDERFLLFTLKHGTYKIYRFHLELKKLINRAVNHFKRKLTANHSK